MVSDPAVAAARALGQGASVNVTGLPPGAGGASSYGMMYYPAAGAGGPATTSGAAVAAGGAAVPPYMYLDPSYAMTAQAPASPSSHHKAGQQQAGSPAQAGQGKTPRGGDRNKNPAARRGTPPRIPPHCYPPHFCLVSGVCL